MPSRAGGSRPRGTVALASALFVAAQQRASPPMLPLDLFGSRGVVLPVAIGLVFMVGNYGLMTPRPQPVGDRRGIPGSSTAAPRTSSPCSARQHGSPPCGSARTTDPEPKGVNHAGSSTARPSRHPRRTAGRTRDPRPHRRHPAADRHLRLWLGPVALPRRRPGQPTHPDGPRIRRHRRRSRHAIAGSAHRTHGHRGRPGPPS